MEDPNQGFTNRDGTGQTARPAPATDRDNRSVRRYRVALYIRYFILNIKYFMGRLVQCFHLKGGLSSPNEPRVLYLTGQSETERDNSIPYHPGRKPGQPVRRSRQTLIQTSNLLFCQQKCQIEESLICTYFLLIHANSVKASWPVGKKVTKRMHVGLPKG